LTQAQAGELHQVVVGHRIRFPSRAVFTGWGSEVFLGALALRRRDAYRLLSMRTRRLAVDRNLPQSSMNRRPGALAGLAMAHIRPPPQPPLD
jgi:hypothetical protein